ncbi:hypothetical protein [Dyadobacter jejuensis]|nr:hypothetical protein [Dyadobacter jejuensis]
MNKNILKQQADFDKRIAITTFSNRKRLSNYFVKSDTLFLIERVDEPSLKSEGAIWNEKRNEVLVFKETDIIYLKKGYMLKIDTTSINYNLWKDPLKSNAERFDTTSLDKHKILGGYRTFITQVIRGKEVKTFYFHDSYSLLNIAK